VAFTFTIATVAKSLQPGWRITETLNGRNVMTFSVLSLDGTYRPASRAVVAFAEDATTLFAGTIQEKSEQGLGGYGVTPIDTQCGAVDFNELPDRRQVEVTIPAGSTLKQALTQVVAYLSPYGVSLDAGQVDGPTFTDALVFEFGPLTAVLNKLSVISGYAWEIDYTKKLRMFVPGVTAAAFNIAADDGHVIGDISVSPSLSDFANQVIVRFTESARAAYAFLSASGNFADGETVTVGSKTYTFQDTLTDSNGNVQIGASAAVSLENLAAAITLDTGAGTAYAASMTVNGSVTAFMQSATLMTARSLSVGASGNSISCTTTASDAAWITEGGGGTTTLLFGADDALTNTVTATTSPAAGDLVELVFAHPEIRDQATAQAMADGYLVRAQVEPREIRYKTLTPGLRPGHKQNIVEARRGLNGDCLITAIDTYAVGNVLWYDVTATDSLVIPSDYKDTFRAWNGGGSGANVSAVLSSGGGGTVSGVGTVGKIAKWSGAEALTDSIITESGSALTVAGSVEATAMTIAGAYVYRVGGTDVSLADGGTNASLTAVNGGLIYSTASAMAVGAAGSAGQIVRSGGAGAPTWSTATYPATATTAGAYLRADGTNWITSTLVLPNAATAGRVALATATNTIGESQYLTYVSGSFTVGSAGNADFNVTAATSGHFAGLVFNQGVTQTWQMYANNTPTPALVWLSGGSFGAMQLSAAGNLIAAGSFAAGGGQTINSSSDIAIANAADTISGAWDFTSTTPIDFGRAISVQVDGVIASGFYDAVKTRGWDALGDDGSGLVLGGYRASQWSGVKLYGAGAVAATFTPSASSIAGTLAANGRVNVAEHVYPTVNWTSDLGSQTLKVRKIYAAELEVDTLVAQDVIATIGGEILTAPTTKLTAALTDSATTISVEHNELASGDRIWLEARGQFEMMAVTSGPSGSGPYTYDVTRNLDGTGANAWLAGDAVVNTGTTGDGYIHQYATGGRFGGTGPSIVGQVRTGTDYNAIATRWAIGNLNGLYGYVADIYGAAFGDPSNAWLKIDATNGIRIGHDATTKISLTAAGDASFTGTVTAAAGAIGGWTIGATSLSATNISLTSGAANTAHLLAGSGSNAGGINSANSGSDIVHWAGAAHADRATAAFRVTGAGALTATSATITGAITASSGSITGDFTIGTSGLLRSGATDYATGTGWVLDYNSGTPRFRVGTTAGNRLAWDGTDLTVVSETVTINGDGISIQPNASALSRFSGYVFNDSDKWGVYGYGDTGTRHTVIKTQHTDTETAETIIESINSAGTGWARVTLGAGGMIPPTIVIATNGGASVSVDDDNGSKIITDGRIIHRGEISPTALEDNTDNWNPTGLSSSRYIRAAASAAYNLTGISAQSNGTEIVLWNGGSHTITLKNDVTSTAANRFLTPGAADYALTQYKGVLIRYDGTSSRWVVLG
jgi:hypothetical protein